MPNAYTDLSDCPDPAELADFLTGNLSGRKFSRVARHVESCGVCERVLGDLEDPADPFLCRLRRAAAAGAPAEQPVPSEFLAAAQSCQGEHSQANGSPAEFPRRLGKFELLEELGVGSFGYVFRACDTELGRTVAIKMLRAGRLASREEVDRFL